MCPTIRAPDLFEKETNLSWDEAVQMQNKFRIVIKKGVLFILLLLSKPFGVDFDGACKVKEWNCIFPEIL